MSALAHTDTFTHTQSESSSSLPVQVEADTNSATVRVAVRDTTARCEYPEFVGGTSLVWFRVIIVAIGNMTHRKVPFLRFRLIMIGDSEVQ